MLRNIIFLRLLVFLGLFWVLPSQGSDLIVLGDLEEPVYIHQHASYLLDGNRRLDFDDLRRLDDYFSPLEKKNAQFGYLQEGVWLRFQLAYQPPVADLEAVSQKYLQIEYALLAVARLVYEDAQGRLHDMDLGQQQPFSARPVSYRHPIFPLKLPAKKPITFYLHVQLLGGSLKAPLKIWDYQPMHRYIATSDFYFGTLLSALLFINIYSLFLFSSLRERIYLVYALFTFLSYLSMVSLSGHGFAFFWSGTPAMNNGILQVTFSLAMVSFVYFIREFLDVKKHFPNFDKVLKVLAAYWGAIAVLAAITSFYFGRIVTASIMPSTIIYIAIGVMTLPHAKRKAQFYLFAYGGALLGLVIYALDQLKVIPSSILTQEGVLLGLVLEVIIFSVALTDRINREKNLKYHAMVAERDALVKVEETKKEIVHMGTHNDLTGYPNKVLFKESVLVKIIEETPFTLCMIKIPALSEVNKTLGYSTGDAIIITYTNLLNQYLKQSSYHSTLEYDQGSWFYLAQIDASHYIFYLNCSKEEFEEGQVKEFLLNAPREVNYQNMSIDLAPIIGVACYPEHGTQFNELQKALNVAMEFAANGTKNFAMFQTHIDAHSERRLILLAELRRAIQKDTVSLNYQPQVSLQTNRVIGVECLLRWHHEKYGFIPPDEFIPLAEKTGLITDVTYWVIKQAYKDFVALKNDGYQINYSINISTRDLRDTQFCETVGKIVDNREHRQQIILEITESSIMENVEESLATLHKLVEMGFRLSVDDFGTGHSSLVYLKLLPVFELKIDRAFIMKFQENQDDRNIVKTIIEMSHSMGLKVVAEGVEDLPTYQALGELGCEIAQGYYMSRPVKAVDLREAIASAEKLLVNESTRENT